MSGIAGWLDFGSDISKLGAVLKEMTRALAPRGPDEGGMYIRPHAALLHRRLAIVDITGGKQPMTALAGEDDVALVYNGELYNTPELRRELTDAGYRMNGYSDTETLLLSYLYWGRACVERFNGIFAFAIYDARDRSLFMARDPMGVKPLFYALRGTGIIFASELKAMLKNPLVKPRLNNEGIAEIMLMGPGRTPGCGVFEGVSELRAGQLAIFENGRIRVRPYWKLQAHEHSDSLPRTVERVRALVTGAIESRLVSDVPVGAFLTGGLNSSIVAAAAAKKAEDEGRSLDTFSIVCGDNTHYPASGSSQGKSESSYIRIMEQSLSIRHHYHAFEANELAGALLDAVKARDLPGMADLDSALLLLCREVKRSCTVALSGACADEVFAGHPWYNHDTPLDAFPWMRSPAYRAGFLAPGVLGRIKPEEYVSQRFSDAVAQAQLLPGDTPKAVRHRQMLLLNLQWFMQTMLEHIERMSMACGLEVRVPFCDKHIVEYMYNVPWEWKNLGGREKGLLRKAMEGILPGEVLWQEKSRYPKMHNPKYPEAVNIMLRRIFDDKKAPLWNIVRRSAVPELLTMDAKEPWYGQLMTAPQAAAWFCQLDMWLREYKVELV